MYTFTSFFCYLIKPTYSFNPPQSVIDVETNHTFQILLYKTYTIYYQNHKKENNKNNIFKNHILHKFASQNTCIYL